MRRFLTCALLILSVGCASDPSMSMTLLDPLDLTQISSELRLLVFPAEQRQCDPVTGDLTPALEESATATFMDAVVDLRFAKTTSASVDLDAGSYTVALRGRGTDIVSMRPDQIVAAGCQNDVLIESDKTRDVRIELLPRFSEGVCGDAIVSADEQCDGASGPQPCQNCQTQSIVAHTTTEMTQERPRVAWANGSRWFLAFNSLEGSRTSRMMLRDQDGQSIEAPTALSLDTLVDDASLRGQQSDPAVASSPGQIAVAFSNFGEDANGDVLLRVMNQDRSGETYLPALDDPSGAQSAPVLAANPSGSILLLFDNGGIATGRVFTNGVGGTPFTLPNAVAPSLAVGASSDGFVIAYATTASAEARTVSSNGALGSAIGLSANGSDLCVGVMGDGRFSVGYIDNGRVVSETFASTGQSIATAELAGAGQNIACTGSASRFAFAWDDGGMVFAATVNPEGALALNRQKPPAAASFLIGAGSQPAVAATDVLLSVVWEQSDDVQTRFVPLP